MSQKVITIRGAREHNLKNITINIPRNKLVVITGVSGSGKSSLAFDTIYAEGQRRYVESLSAYARQFLDQMQKPDLDSIEGLSPAISIEQKSSSRNPRSTVGTITEIHDYLRLLFARIGVPFSPKTGLAIKSQNISEIVDKIIAWPTGEKLYILAPIVRGRKGEYRREILEWKRRGFLRLKINGKIYEIDKLPTIDKNKKNDISILVDRIVLSSDLRQRIVESVETANNLSDGIIIVDRLSKNSEEIFSLKYACPVSGFTIEEIEPRLFSFNSPHGACPSCDGLGKSVAFDINLIVPDKKKPLNKNALAPWSRSGSMAPYYLGMITSLAKHYSFNVSDSFATLPKKIQDVILYGSGEEKIEFVFQENLREHRIKRTFEGVVNNLKRRLRETESKYSIEDLSKYQSKDTCSKCHGYRVNEKALAIKIANLHIGQINEFSILQAYEWFDMLPNKLSKQENQIAKLIIKEIKERLSFLKNVGLEYLTLARGAKTLSGGESQRIRLASQIGSGLTGVLYVLDEPSIGLHQKDNNKLIQTLISLKEQGNTVIVVEHDEDTMLRADHLIDIGLGAGKHGGSIIAQGTPSEVMGVEDSLTAKYLSGRLKIDIPKKRRTISPGMVLKLTNARSNNLKNVNLTVPLGVLTCITGVSGSGKSSLIIDTLYNSMFNIINNSNHPVGSYDKIEGIHLVNKVIDIDQSAIGRTPRSNPATYTGAFTHIRSWFAALPEAKARGYGAGRFSFNVKGGRCEACQGDGLIKMEMHFLPDVFVRCEVCKGLRYNGETLEIKYKDKSISDVLKMTVEEGYKFFKNNPLISEKLEMLQKVGLGYINIGQSATTFSGGEAQRIKLSKELSKRATGRTLYILDEPTTGLHASDVNKLLSVLQSLVEYGNTVVIIEHNLDVIKTADWVIDLGIGGGNKGGQIIAAGTPEKIAKTKKSYTGQFLADKLNRK